MHTHQPGGSAPSFSGFRNAGRTVFLAAVVAGSLAIGPLSAMAGTPSQAEPALPEHAPGIAHEHVDVIEVGSPEYVARLKADGELDPESSGTPVDESGSTIPAAPCTSGTDTGPKVEVVYVWPSGRTSSLSSLQTEIWDRVNRLDHRLNSSATNWEQHFRWLCASYSGVNKVRLSSFQVTGERDTDGKLSYRAIVNEMHERGGFSATNRRYLVMVDDSTISTAGRGTEEIGTCYYGPMNPSLAGCNTDHQGGPRYALVRRWSNSNWSSSGMLHELLHTVGATTCESQNLFESPSYCATYSIDTGHTDDGHDVMGTGTLCSGYSDAWFVDCNKDDYWYPANPSVNPGTSSFNVARSVFLTTPKPK